MTWLSITIAGILTYFTRMTMIALVRRDLLGEKIKAVLAYVPSAVFKKCYCNYILWPFILLDHHICFFILTILILLTQLTHSCFDQI